MTTKATAASLATMGGLMTGLAQFADAGASPTGCALVALCQHLGPSDGRFQGLEDNDHVQLMVSVGALREARKAAGLPV